MPKESRKRGPGRLLYKAMVIRVPRDAKVLCTADQEKVQSSQLTIPCSDHTLLQQSQEKQRNACESESSAARGQNLTTSMWQSLDTLGWIQSIYSLSPGKTGRESLF